MQNFTALSDLLNNINGDLINNINGSPAKDLVQRGFSQSQNLLQNDIPANNVQPINFGQQHPYLNALINSFGTQPTNYTPDTQGGQHPVLNNLNNLFKSQQFGTVMNGINDSMAKRNTNNYVTLPNRVTINMADYQGSPMTSFVNGATQGFQNLHNLQQRTDNINKLTEQFGLPHLNGLVTDQNLSDYGTFSKLGNDANTAKINALAKQAELQKAINEANKPQDVKTMTHRQLLAELKANNPNLYKNYIETYDISMNPDGTQKNAKWLDEPISKETANIILQNKPGIGAMEELLKGNQVVTESGKPALQQAQIAAIWNAMQTGKFKNAMDVQKFIAGLASDGSLQGGADITIPQVPTAPTGGSSGGSVDLPSIGNLPPVPAYNGIPANVPTPIHVNQKPDKSSKKDSEKQQEAKKSLERYSANLDQLNKLMYGFKSPENIIEQAGMNAQLLTQPNHTTPAIAAYNAQKKHVALTGMKAIEDQTGRPSMYSQKMLEETLPKWDDPMPVKKAKMEQFQNQVQTAMDINHKGVSYKSPYGSSNSINSTLPQNQKVMTDGHGNRAIVQIDSNGKPIKVIKEL